MSSAPSGPPYTGTGPTPYNITGPAAPGIHAANMGPIMGQTTVTKDDDDFDHLAGVISSPQQQIGGATSSGAARGGASTTTILGSIFPQLGNWIAGNPGGVSTSIAINVVGKEKSNSRWKQNKVVGKEKSANIFLRDELLAPGRDTNIRGSDPEEDSQKVRVVRLDGQSESLEYDDEVDGNGNAERGSGGDFFQDSFMESETNKFNMIGGPENPENPEVILARRVKGGGY